MAYWFFGVFFLIDKVIPLFPLSADGRVRSFGYLDKEAEGAKSKTENLTILLMPICKR